MTSNCDVTNSAHQIKMTTICHWMKNPRWKFSAYATLRSTCHKCDKCVRVGYIFTMKQVKSKTLIECLWLADSIVSGLLPVTYWFWYRNDSVRETSTTGIALICNKFLLLLCNDFNDTLTSLIYFPFCILSICFLSTILWEVARELSFFLIWPVDQKYFGTALHNSSVAEINV